MIKSMSKRMINLSKSLAFLLRDTARDEGLDIDCEGFVDLNSILALPRFAKYSEEEVMRLVETSDKQRFSLAVTSDDGSGSHVRIRANQGHTIPDVNPGLIRITDPERFPKVVHGTAAELYFALIRFEGLHRMGRNHIHLATGEPGESGVISGMSDDSSIYIYVDIEKAMADHYDFYESLNGVVLTPGNEEGFLPSKYFSAVRHKDAGYDLDDYVKNDFLRDEFKLINVADFRFLIHPTTHKKYSRIRRLGLRKTKGNYVNLISSEPSCKQKEIQVLIYLQVAKVAGEAAEKFKFLRFQEDGEIFVSGFLSADYFEKVVEAKTGVLLPF